MATPPTRAPTTTASTALARNGTANRQLAAEIAPREWTRAYLDTLKATFFRGLSDEEAALAVQVSKATGLRIDTRELWCYKRGPGEPLTLDISIDGLRAIAFASGVFAGEEGPLFCGKDGVYTDTWLSDDLPIAARAQVWRSDVPRPFPAVCQMREFRAFGGKSPVWEKAPIWQLGLKASKHAYRKGWRREIAAAERAILDSGARLGEDEGRGPQIIDQEPSPSPARAESRIVDAHTGEVVSARPPTAAPAPGLEADYAAAPPEDADAVDLGGASEVADSTTLSVAEAPPIADDPWERYARAWDALVERTGQAPKRPRELGPDVSEEEVLRLAGVAEQWLATHPAKATPVPTPAAAGE